MCGNQHTPEELIDPRSTISDATPEMRETVHLWLDMWSVSDTLATSTLGARYVFADLDRTTVSFDTRLDVTFTPTLSLQLYLEPFISVLSEFAALWAGPCPPSTSG